MTPFYILLCILAAINLFSFVVMANDKRKSIQHGADRTPEGLLFFLAAAFGSVGVYIGMFSFRHKTKKWYFLLGIPLLIAQNVVTMYFLSTLF
jgi:uncharacterized membrane protein YsdA (DUF1294 family)